jgi:succinate-semialdehyde dehydrogenase/glutarate-semialdehyde dehydrogenase
MHKKGSRFWPKLWLRNRPPRTNHRDIAVNKPLHNLTADLPTDLYIGGRWRPASDKLRFDVIDPATEDPIASVASASVEDAKAAVDAADAAFEPWAARKPRERAEILRKAFELLTREAERFAKLITLENGKSLSDARGEVAYSAEFFRWYAEEAVRNIGEVSRAPASGARILVQHKPAGVALLVTPWNFPLAMATRKIGPALAAGCPVVVKPASETPLTMLALMPLLEEAGVPAGIVNVIPSRRSGPVVDAILKDMRVRVVSFTGSTQVGRTLLHAAADNVVKPVMELGGNAPFIVFEDADIDAAVEGAMIAKMRNMGEACTAANRFLIHEKVHDAFARKLAEKMNALKMGNGLEDGVALGPLVNASTRDKVAALVADAVGKGAKVLTGGQKPAGKGYFYPATVLSAVPDNADLIREEIFGPVAPIQTFTEEADAIRRANDTEYGLVAYLYTRDLSRGMRVSEKLDFGMVGLNRGIVSDPAAPFGGTKQSGLGREGAHEGILEFQETQYISVTW